MRIAMLAGFLLTGCMAAKPGCVPVGAWADPGTLRVVADPVGGAAARPVVLLGETHDSAADHAWELDAIRRLVAAQPSRVLGLEMFPRGDQKVLDAWVRGELSEAAFLRQTDWADVWGFPPELYMPIFRFARDHRVPMLALNVSHRLVHLTGQHGWAGVAVADREGVGTPAPPGAAYRAELADVMSGHGGPPMTPDRLQRFVDAQLVWDRAMAEAIAQRRARMPAQSVIAIMGAGHLENRDGVPHQLASLGIGDALVLIPVAQACTPPGAGYADALYVTGPDVTRPDVTQAKVTRAVGAAPRS